MKTFLAVVGAISLAGVAAGAAQAQNSIPYANAGTYNNTTYTFTAAANGDVIAYFAGSGAGDDNRLGLLVNGKPQGGFGLDNQASTLGQSYDFGAVKAGDSLTFVLENVTLGKDAYSDPALNTAFDAGTTGGHNHVYATNFNGSNPGGLAAPLTAAGVPHGVDVGFEDEPFSNSDYSYFDESAVFTNVVLDGVSSAPEPTTWALALMGIAMLGVALRNRKPAPALA